MPRLSDGKLEPDGYAYRYPDGIHFGTGGREINGSRPLAVLPLYLESTIDALRAELTQARLEAAGAYASARELVDFIRPALSYLPPCDCDTEVGYQCVQCYINKCMYDYDNTTDTPAHARLAGEIRVAEAVRDEAKWWHRLVCMYLLSCTPHIGDTKQSTDRLTAAEAHLAKLLEQQRSLK